MLRRIKNLILHRQPAVNNLTAGPWLKRKNPVASGSTAPVNTVAPAVTGTAAVGQVLTCSQGTWTGTPTPTYAYQWLRGGSNISGATSSTYTVISGDSGTTLSCRVTATNAAGSASATSNGVAIPAAFSPASLFASGEQGAWYDPSDFSTMFQDSAGTTPVTAAGQTVGRINDKSGRNNHASQTTASARPVLRQDANSKYYLEFDGVEDRFVVNLSGSIASAMSLFAGFKLNVFSVGLNLFEVSSTNRADSSAGIQSGATDTLTCYTFGTGYSSEVGYTKTTNAGLNQVYTTYSPSPSVIRFNGVQAATNAGTAWPDAPITKISIGCDTSAGNFAAIRLYSIIVRGALSTTQEITNTETWVNSKTVAY
jgi:hypothetical protein